MAPLTRSERTRTGFTLIEMIAVVLILGLAMSLVIPNLSASREGRLRDQAKQIAGRLEVARQRAITSGTPHRLLIELEDGRYRIDWWVDEATAYAHEADPDEVPEPEPEPDLNGPIQMSPPLGEQRDFHPIPGQFGNDVVLSDEYFFLGVDTESGWYESGDVEIVFAGDGTASYTEISISDAWDNVVILELQPLIELVRIRRAGDG